MRKILTHFKVHCVMIWWHLYIVRGLPRCISNISTSPRHGLPLWRSALQCWDLEFVLRWKNPLEKERLPLPVFCAGAFLDRKEPSGLQSHGSHQEWDMTERLSTHSPCIFAFLLWVNFLLLLYGRRILGTWDCHWPRHHLIYLVHIYYLVACFLFVSIFCVFLFHLPFIWINPPIFIIFFY